MKKTLLFIATLLTSYLGMAQETYHPTAENLKAREQFQDEKFGIFLHWGLYSMMGTTEWIMTNRDINYKEYPKLAKTFYPSEFDGGCLGESYQGCWCKVYHHYDTPPRWILTL